jgi:cytochrome c peroxidase
MTIPHRLSGIDQNSKDPQVAVGYPSPCSSGRASPAPPAERQRHDEKRSTPAGVEKCARSIRVFVAVVGLIGFALEWHASGAAERAQFRPHVPLGLPRLNVPAENPLTRDKVELGRQLYFDKRLSVDDSVACVSCHDPRQGWGDGRNVSQGVQGKRGGRSAPSIVNAAYQTVQFWDGRAATLEEQALGPITNEKEMGMPSIEAAVEKLNRIPGYQREFEEVFDGPATAERLAQALAAFERTLLAGDAPYDRFQAGDRAALSESAQRGAQLFLGKAHCTACHIGPNFSDHAFHNLGVGVQSVAPDAGREAVSKLLGDRGSFKTSSLRDVARTAPYMHDGSLKTLADVIAYYNQGGHANDQLDEEIYPLNLTPREQQDLLTFLEEGLTSYDYPASDVPALPK